MLVLKVVKDLRSKIGIMRIVSGGSIGGVVGLNEACEFTGRLSLHERRHYSFIVN